MLDLPEYKLKIVNICEMHGTGGGGGVKLWCLTDFHVCRNCKKIDEKVLSFSI